MENICLAAKNWWKIFIFQKLLMKSFTFCIAGSYSNQTFSTYCLLTLLISMSLQSFTNILQSSFAQYLAISDQIGGDVSEHSKLVAQAFQAQLRYLLVASQSKAPSSQADQVALLQPTSQYITAIQEYREKHRVSPYFNHLSAISESIPALGWVAVVNDFFMY